MNLPFNTCLVLAPHTDDGELGAGGLITKLTNNGTEVHYVAFSTAKESVPDGFPADILTSEVKEATRRLGIPPSNLTILDYPVRKFTSYRQEILEELVALRGKIKPDLVLTTCSFDVHQDHQVIHNEAKRAFKTVSILGYELLWNEVGVSNFNFFLKLSEIEMEAKLVSLKAYNSQKGRQYFKDENLKSLARVRGLQVGAEYAEAFEVVRVALS